ncbi:MAG: hypothetical protein WA151_11310 [Desulfatirhabdiaceae bacterium]
MAFPDFNAKIDIRYYADKWGLFSVNLTDADGVTGIPSDESITAVAVKMFEGIITPEDSISGLTDVSSSLIEADSLSFSGKDIYWEMMYPVTPGAFIGKKYTMIFEVTTTDARKFPFYLYYVKVW